MKARPVLWGMVISMVVGMGLWMPAPVQAQMNPQELQNIQNFLKLMHSYLEISSQWYSLVSNREIAVYLAVDGIVELYEQKGNKMDAIPVLRDLMKRYGNNPTIRTIIRFKIRDILKDNGRVDEALKELMAIIDENARR